MNLRVLSALNETFVNSRSTFTRTLSDFRSPFDTPRADRRTLPAFGKTVVNLRVLTVVLATRCERTSRSGKRRQEGYLRQDLRPEFHQTLLDSSQPSTSPARNEGQLRFPARLIVNFRVLTVVLRPTPRTDWIQINEGESAHITAGHYFLISSILLFRL